MKKHASLPAALALALAIPGAAIAAPARAQPHDCRVRVEHAWVRWLPAGLPMGGYMSLHNGGTRTVALTGARSTGFDGVMLHRSMRRGGLDTMQPVAAVSIPAGGTVRFAPGGYHLMLMGAAATVQPGARVRIELQFAGCAPQSVLFRVRDAGGRP